MLVTLPQIIILQKSFVSQALRLVRSLEELEEELRDLTLGDGEKSVAKLLKNRRWLQYVHLF